MKQISDFQSENLTIAVAADHGGFQLKGVVVKLLETMGHKAVDCGCASAEACDYPDYAAKAAMMVSDSKADCAILICRSGVGMNISANRFHGVRATIAADENIVKLSRQHNCANVLVIAADMTDAEAAEKMVKVFLSTPFSNEERHAARLFKLEQKCYDDIAAVRVADPEIAAMIDAEAIRQRDGIELIASENFASCAVRAAQGSVLTNKYAEGYSGKRYYNGCEFIDQIESLAIERAKALFGAEAANVQPHSGSGANQAIYILGGQRKRPFKELLAPFYRLVYRSSR